MQIASFTIILFFVKFRQSLGDLSEADIDAILSGSVDDAGFDSMERIFAATKGRSSSYRRYLKAGNIFSGNSPRTLSCGGTYAVGGFGHIFWRMNSKSTPCYHAFLGSRAQNCRVGIMCDGVVEFESPSSAGCDKEYLKLTDGTLGSMTGCGRFTFRDKPRFARNNGTDIYVYYKGQSSQLCVALCIEDINESHDLKSPTEMSTNRQFQGFQLEESCTCGKRRDLARVVGGEEALPYEFGWLAAIVFAGSGSRKRLPFCGAALINDRYVLSAAHCFAVNNVRPEQVQVLLHAHVMDKKYKYGFSRDDARYDDIPGWSRADETDESESSIRVDVEEILNHPLFDEDTYDWDVAILKLKERINFATKKVTPICLPLISETLNYRVDETNFVVAGWGYHLENAITASRVVQKLEVPFVDFANCQKFTYPMRRHVCAGYPEGGKDACRGDSGGPLISMYNKDKNQYVLSGVVSAGEGCARIRKVGVYTDTMEIVQWVYHNTADSIWCDR